MHNVPKNKIYGFNAAITTGERNLTKHAKPAFYKEREKDLYRIFLKYSNQYNLKKCKVVELDIKGGQDVYEVGCCNLFNAKVFLKNKKIYLEAARTEKYLLFIILSNIFLSILILRLFKNNCILLHAGCTVYKKQAYIFSGHPSAGKTTLCNMLKHKMKVLTDELVIIRKKNRIWTAKPAPFRLWDTKYSNKAYPIAAMFQLKKAKRFNISPVSFKNSISFLISDIPYLPDSKEICSKVLTRAESLAKEIPSYSLEFTKKEIPFDRLLFPVGGAGNQID